MREKRRLHKPKPQERQWARADFPVGVLVVAGAKIVLPKQTVMGLGLHAP